MTKNGARHAGVAGELSTCDGRPRGGGGGSPLLAIECCLPNLRAPVARPRWLWRRSPLYRGCTAHREVRRPRVRVVQVAQGTPGTPPVALTGLALVRPVARRAALSPRLRTRCRVPVGLLRALRHRAGGGSERARRGQVCGTSGRRPLSVSRFAGTTRALRGCASAGAFLAVCSRVQPTRRGPREAHALGRACFPTRPRVEPRGVCASTQTLARPLRPPDTRPQA